MSARLDMLVTEDEEGDMVVDWVTPTLAFVGGGGGAWLSYRAARRATLVRHQDDSHDLSQREGQGRREEWGRRFTAALDDIASDDFRRRELGRAVLVHLSDSALATGEEKALAEVVLETGARLEGSGDLLADPAAGLVVDDLAFVEDDGEHEPEGRRRGQARDQGRP